MNILEWAKNIFESKTIEGKLISSNSISSYELIVVDVDITHPGRGYRYKPSSEKIKFPKTTAFKDIKVRAKALSFFANHELEAIEMMAAAIIKFSSEVKSSEFSKIARGIVSSISDEQKHFQLYTNRMKDFGAEFGDFPLNNFFWKQFHRLNNFSDFFSLMSLTFEAANLDFCLHYQRIFTQIGDQRTAGIFQVVFDDEINHVKLGSYWLNKWRGDDSLWHYYCRHLPNNITPERSKGICFSALNRKRAGFDEDFILPLVNYSDSFKIPKRKSNKNVLPK